MNKIENNNHFQLRVPKFIMKLSELPKRKTAKIKAILTQDIEKEMIQFIEKGFLPNENIQIIRKAPFNGPLKLRIGNSKVFIRKDQADNILVQI